MITVHSIEYSRATRVLWLLEHLGLDYELVKHKRDGADRAPAEMRAIHPLGTSPILIDGTLVLAESSAILRYVHARYGDGSLAPPAGTDAAALHDEWLDYSESSAKLSFMMTIRAQEFGQTEGMRRSYVEPEIRKTLDYITAGIGDGPFLMGAQLTLADMQMVFTLAIAERAKLLDGRSTIRAYQRRLGEQPALQRALERGGPMIP